MSSIKNKGPLLDPATCRCCKSVKKCRVLNYEYNWMDKLEIYTHMFVDCFGLLLSQVDGDTSSGICATCVVRLRDACAFKAQVLQCEEFFLKEKLIISNEGQIKSEPIDDNSDGDHLSYDVCMSDEYDLKEQDTKQTIVEVPVNVKVEGHQSGGNMAVEDDQIESKKITVKRVIKAIKPKKRRIKPLRRDGPVSGTSLKHSTNSIHSVLRKEDENEHMVESNLLNLAEYSFACPFSNRFSSYFCFYCTEMFTDPTLLREHTSQHNPKLYQKIFKRRSYPKFDITKIDCRLCPAKIDNLNTFREHLYNAHGKKYYKIKDEFLAFRLTDAEMRCLECDEAFPYFDKLLKHTVEHYGNYTCDVCGEAFLTETSLKRHLNENHKKNNECHDCEKSFVSQQSLQIHLNTVHKKEPTISCLKCDAMLFTYSARATHMQEVHGICDRYPCNLCDRVYYRKRSLNEHKRRFHGDVKRHKCEFCSERFFTPCLLRDHLTTHTGEKKYRCDFCEKSYPRLKTLKLHIRIHTNDRRYKCQVCSSAFVQNISLKSHMKSHHPDFVNNT